MQVNMRREVRRPKRGTYSICWQDTDNSTRSADVDVVDISPSGTRIRCPHQLYPGAEIYIEAPDAHPTGYSTVRYCFPNDGSYFIGLEFHDDTKATVTLDLNAPPEIDYYEFLQISSKAELPTIHRIYRFLASRFHPDNPETGDPEKFLLLNRAFDVLSDPDRRALYDASREAAHSDTRPFPIFELSEFVNGIEGEVNRRLGVLSLLYNQRRTNSENPKVSLYDLERRMGWPREYLDFTTWYLRSKGYITREDNSDFTLTALGVDYVEQNYTQIPILQRLLNSGSRTATSGNGHHKSGPKEILLLEGEEPPLEKPASSTATAP
jgi:curved DNA-binding protein CbpA